MANLQENSVHSDSLNSLKYIIIQGPAFVEQALTRLKSMNKTDLVQNSDTDENILQVAATFQGDVKVMERLVMLCPELLALEREGEYEGQNVLHILISKENLKGAEAILTHPILKEADYKQHLLKGQAVGTRFAGTVLMGELPLSVAALTLNLEMVDLLLGHGARLQEVNSQGDTLLHSLIRFAHLYPSKEPEVATMMKEIHTRLQSPKTAPSKEAEPRCVWLIENNQGLTALKLAAALPVPSLFRMILELEGVYCILDRRDGLFDSLLYDVTEIDPIAAKQQRREKNQRRPQHNGVAPFHADREPSPFHFQPGCFPDADTPSPSAMKKPHNEERFASVLEILCETGRMEKAFKMINSHVIQKIIQAKWRHYFWWFLLWAFSHVLLMILLTTHAVFKARLIQKAEEAAALSTFTATTTTVPPTSLSTSISATRSVRNASLPPTLKNEEVFVEVMAVVGCLVSLVMVGMEGVRQRRGVRFHLQLIHHNGLYRVQLLILALAVIADSVWYRISGPVNNFFLILALLVGWWFCTFFLRPWHKLSFFTVMLQKVLVGDMVRFSFVILLALGTFSVVMHVTFLATPGGPPREFQHLGMALLTMFKLGLGLADVEVLEEASHPWLSTLLFVVFVVLTYLLMLNALIAMMANTCSLISQDKTGQWKLQRLSVVLLVESMLPRHRRLLCNTGQPKPVARYDLQKSRVVQETRYFIKVTKVKSSCKERGAAILKRNPLMQTQSLDNLNATLTSTGNVMLSMDKTMTSTASNMAHLDLLAAFAHQQAWLSSPDRNNLASASSTENTGHSRSDEQTEQNAQRRSPRKSKGKKRAVQKSKGEEESHSYTLMRQALLKAAQPMVSPLSTFRQTSKELSDAGLENEPSNMTDRAVGKGKFLISRQPIKVQSEMPPPEVHTISSKYPKNDTSANL